MQRYTEDELTARLSNADTRRQAFTQVVSDYGEKIYWMIRKMGMTHDDTNDVVQNTFLKAWSNLDSFRGEAKVSTWLYKIAVNENITFMNKQRAANFVSLDDIDSYLLDKLKSDDYYIGDDLQLKFQEAINQLPEKQRLVFTMKYFDDMKYEDMSDVLGTSVGALKASYHHATKKIEAFLTDDL
ncbi:MAG: sigma-70 family RNA polymerase sigma factor [Tannerella sp.]|jgi:RNA polymerase sigma-70 factor (ECF subfamily)|nr:sigma-70 family RNA polymerase sigma factor [Tannerella sp.]